MACGRRVSDNDIKSSQLSKTACKALILFRADGRWTRMLRLQRTHLPCMRNVPTACRLESLGLPEQWNSEPAKCIRISLTEEPGHFRCQSFRDDRPSSRSLVLRTPPLHSSFYKHRIDGQIARKHNPTDTGGEPSGSLRTDMGT